jgi:hypothetical protein
MMHDKIRTREPAAQPVAAASEKAAKDIPIRGSI